MKHPALSLDEKRRVRSLTKALNKHLKDKGR